jgi:hypothetical protein
MRAKVILALTLIVGVLALTIAVLRPSQPPVAQAPDQADPAPGAEPVHSPPTLARRETRPTSPPVVPRASETAPKPPAQSPFASTSKLERLNALREAFRALAGGDPGAALRAAKQLTDATERETALLTLVTVWSRGELSPPRARAGAIAAYGLEAGLGLELARFPELAVAWANELTEVAGRTVILQQTAVSLLNSDPTAAFAMSDLLPEQERSAFTDTVFAGWAEQDTAAAIAWASQLPDSAGRDDALRAIRSVAPVGIGAALSVQEGFPVIHQLLPGSPADLSGQLHPGDRVLALAQEDNAFVDAHDLPLPEVVQMVRGATGTVLRLQVLEADAPPNAQPRTVSIFRDQIMLKR